MSTFLKNCILRSQENLGLYHYRKYLSSCLMTITTITIMMLATSLAQSQNGEPLIPDHLSQFATTEISEKLVGKCDACRALVKSFIQGMEATARGKHEGGDTSWEEKNLKSYANSEVRLVEIQEQLCIDLKDGKAECLAIAEDTESDVEEWWSKHRTKNVRLMDFLCINRIKTCCPEGKFGPNCQSCPKNCGKNGKCHGSGTRQGDGYCQCHSGYTGELCNQCSGGYYRLDTSTNLETDGLGGKDLSQQHDINSTCNKCDQACVECDGPGPLRCLTCANGYRLDSQNGCVDINECDPSELGEKKTNCDGNTFCVNTEGSSECQECHESCEGCHGYGASMCNKCASGYQLLHNSCQKEGTQHSSGLSDKYKNQMSHFYIYTYLLAFLMGVVMFKQQLKILGFFSIGLIVFIALVETNKGLPVIDTILSTSN